MQRINWYHIHGCSGSTGALIPDHRTLSNSGYGAGFPAVPIVLKDGDAMWFASRRMVKQYGSLGYCKIAVLACTEGWKVKCEKIELT